MTCIEPEGAFYAYPNLTGLLGPTDRGPHRVDHARAGRRCCSTKPRSPSSPARRSARPATPRISFALGDDDLGEGLQRIVGRGRLRSGLGMARVLVTEEIADRRTRPAARRGARRRRPARAVARGAARRGRGAHALDHPLGDARSRPRYSTPADEHGRRRPRRHRARQRRRRARHRAGRHGRQRAAVERPVRRRTDAWRCCWRRRATSRRRTPRSRTVDGSAAGGRASSSPTRCSASSASAASASWSRSGHLPSACDCWRTTRSCRRTEPAR